MTDAKGKAARNYVQAERRLLSEWIAAEHPNDRVLMHVYVGPREPLTKFDSLSVAEYNMLGVRRRWVDAIIVYKDRVEIVESKVISEPFVVAQIELYMELFPLTPELSDISRLPASGVLVSAIPDPNVTSYLNRRGIREIVFSPPWVPYYLQSKPWRKRVPRSMPGLSNS